MQVILFNACTEVEVENVYQKSNLYILFYSMRHVVFHYLSLL